MFRYTRIVFSAALLLLMLMPAAAQESVVFPTLAGEYAVGRLAYDVDAGRLEIFTDDPGDSRIIPITVYYPAVLDEGAAASPYVSELESAAYAQGMGIPNTLFSLVQPHAVDAAPAAESPDDAGFPVLLFSPGLATPVKYYTSLVEQVASHGYIVAIVDHPYSTGLSVYTSGEFVTIAPAAIDMQNEAQRLVILGEWVADSSAALDWLETANESDPVLAGRIDTSRVGAFGHSFGGATSVQLTVDDERVLAAIDMDGTLSGSVTEDGTPRPILFIEAAGTGDAARVTDEELAAAGMTREQYDAILAEYVDSVAAVLETAPAAYRLELADAQHMTFASDMGLVRPLLSTFITDEIVGTVDAERAVLATTAYTVAFFDEHVRGKESVLLDGDSPEWPEVDFEIVNE
jgi:dienelactone hydrolase